MGQEVQRAIAANKEARDGLRKILNGDVGPRLQALYLAQAAMHLLTNFEALVEIRDIVNGNLSDISEEELLEHVRTLLENS